MTGKEATELLKNKNITGWFYMGSMYKAKDGRIVCLIKHLTIEERELLEEVMGNE